MYWLVFSSTSQLLFLEESLPPVKMQYLLNFHIKELETTLCDELLKLKWNVKCVKPGNQCLSIEVRNYTDDCVVEDVIFCFRLGKN
jgi:hypothetical protein